MEGRLLQAWQPRCVDIRLSINRKFTWKLSFFTVAADDRFLPTDLNWTFDSFTRKLRLWFPILLLANNF